MTFQPTGTSVPDQSADHQFLPYVPMPRIVRGGRRYKGQSYEVMAKDVRYCEYALNTGLFKDSDPAAHAFLVSLYGDTETPLHNKRQAAFLKEEFRTAFLDLAIPGYERKVREGFREKLFALREKTGSRVTACRKGTSSQKLQEAMAEYRKTDRIVSVLVSDFYVETASIVRFERKRIDVEIVVTVTVRYPDHINIDQLPKPLRCPKEHFILPVEIKPRVGEDWPIVLRQMDITNTKYLLIDEYTGGEGTTEEEFLDIFSASGKIVIRRADVYDRYQHEMNMSSRRFASNEDYSSLLG